jgi:transposase, IS30 family
LFVNWDYIRDGMSAAEAGVAIGVSARTRRKWFADGDGVTPEFTDDKPCKWSRLTLEERVEITVGDAFCYARDSAQDPDMGSGS